MSTIFSKEYANLYLYENYNRKILKSIDFSFAYFNENNILIKKHCDFGCGTGDICSYIKKMNIHTLGIDLSPGMIDVAKNNYPDIEFKVGNIINFKLKNKVDFINCSFDTINHLVEFKDWDYLFKNVKNNLNEKGFFLFDFVTEQKLKNCVSTQFKTNENYDCVNEIRIIEKNKVEINKTYYIKEDNRYKKINQKIVEAVFRTDDVFDLLRKNNFRVLFKLNKSLQITNNSNSNRMYVLCQKC